jgi:integration host factor subunit beta
MNRSDIVKSLAHRFSYLQQADAEVAVSSILQTMANAMARGHRIEIRGFGSFTIVQRAPRTGRNPRSGARVDVPEMRIAHFKPGKALRAAVDLPEAVQRQPK